MYERPVDLGVRRREVQREDQKPGIPGIRLATFVDQQEMPYVAMPDAPKTDLDYDAFNWESDSVNVDERISVADLGHTFLGGTVKLTRRNVVEPDSAPSLEETNKNFCANAACDQGEECVVPSLITIPDSNDLIINKNFHRDVSSDIDLILQTAIANENLLSSSTNDSKQNDYENYYLVDILEYNLLLNISGDINTDVTLWKDHENNKISNFAKHEIWVDCPNGGNGEIPDREPDILLTGKENLVKLVLAEYIYKDENNENDLANELSRKPVHETYMCIKSTLLKCDVDNDDNIENENLFEYTSLNAGSGSGSDEKQFMSVFKKYVVKKTVHNATADVRNEILVCPNAHQTSAFLHNLPILPEGKY